MSNGPLKILLCEDDDNLGVILKELLEKHFSVDLYTDGEDGWKNFLTNKYDLCLLDVNMPKKDGFTLAKEIRKINSNIPIIFLTAKTNKSDVFQGFHAGADDYITKPFSLDELLLRIEAILRRTNNWVVEQDKPSKYQIGQFVFDTVNQTLTHNGETMHLTTKESELLAMLCMYSNQTLERSHALREIWNIYDTTGDNADENSFTQRSMDVYITKLRRMLKSDPSIEIKNVHGKGYKLVIPNTITNNTLD